MMLTIMHLYELLMLLLCSDSLLPLFLNVFLMLFLLLLLELPGTPHACADQDQAAELAGNMTFGAC